MKVFCLTVCFVLGFSSVSSECIQWKRDLIVESGAPKGVVMFRVTTTALYKCARLCFDKDSCVIFSYDQTNMTCTGVESFASTETNSSNVQVIPAPIFHIGLDKVYILHGSMRLQIHQELASFEKAREICRRTNGRLAVMETKEKISDTTSFTKGAVDTFWVGLSDATKEGSWIWDNGLEFEPQDIFVDFNNEDGNYTNADCAVFGSHHIAFWDKNCNNPNAFVCESFP